MTNSYPKIPADAFDGAYSKVLRADKHINELIALLKQINQTGTNKLIRGVQPDGGETLQFSQLGPLGHTIPLIVGDAVHNLRAAFDHAWVQLAIVAEPERATVSGVKFAIFPFDETRKNLEARIKGPVSKTFPEIERLIVEGIKPYGEAGGNRLLWAITKLDKIDKHNLIITVAHVSRVHHAVLRTGRTRIEMVGCTFSAKETEFASRGAIENEGEPQVTIEIAFPPDDLLGGEPVIPTLISMSQATHKALDLIIGEVCR